MIVQQQPENVCDGLDNLLTTISDNITCDTVTSTGSTDCGSVVCSIDDEMLEESFTLMPLHCNRSIAVNITSRTNSSDAPLTLSEILYSMSQPQQLKYGDNHVNISFEVVYVNETEEEYYILSLESSLGFHFPLTAIPLNCPAAGVCVVLPK